MPGSGLAVWYRGEFAATASLRASIRSMHVLPTHAKANVQMPPCRLTEFMARCQWHHESIHVLLTPSVASLTCYALNMVGFSNSRVMYE